MIEALAPSSRTAYTIDMKTTVGDRGRTVIPALIRKRFKLEPRQKLEWAEDGRVIYLLPVEKDPIAAFRGSSRNGLSRALLANRKEF